MENEKFVPTIKITEEMKRDAFNRICDLCYDAASEYAFDDINLNKMYIDLSIIKNCLHV